MEKTALNFALEKTAGIFSRMGQMKDTFSHVGGAINKGLNSANPEEMERAAKLMSQTAGSLVGAGTTALLGAYGVKKIIDGLMNDHTRKAMLEDLIMCDPIIKQADPDKVKEFYATIHYMAPKLSGDRNIVRELLQNFIKFDRVDIASIKALADTQKSMLQGESQLMKGMFRG